MTAPVRTPAPRRAAPSEAASTRPNSSAAQVRLVAAREIATRIRDKSFLIGSAVLIVLILGMLVFQVAINSGDSGPRIGLVGGSPEVEQALQAQGEAFGTVVEVVELAGEAAARTAVEAEDVDAALLDPAGAQPELVLPGADAQLESLVQSTVQGLSVSDQLSAAGVQLQPAPEVEVVALEGDTGNDTEATVVALVGVVLLYSLLILLGQVIAQGVVEEKSSRVVELLLATMRPWQLLAGKIIGLGLLGLAQLVVIAVVGVAGALAFDVVALPGRLIGTVVTVVAWFVLGYAFYASLFAAAASLVSRQEDVASVITPASIVLILGFVIALQAAQDPGSTLATVTSYLPGLSPMVMPVRQAAGDAAWWELALAVVLMLVAIAVVVRIGGRIYAGALLRTGGKVKLREALRAERA